MGANELRAAGFSSSELRLAGFSHTVLSQTNKQLRSFICKGNLKILPQLNPKCDPQRMKATAFLKLWTGGAAQVPKQMTPRIREHTDYVPRSKVSRPFSSSASMDVGIKSWEIDSIGIGLRRPLTTA